MISRSRGSRSSTSTRYPARHGHFLLESGDHTDLWVTLDALFVDPAVIALCVTTLADQLHAHTPTATPYSSDTSRGVLQLNATTIGA